MATQELPHEKSPVDEPPVDEVPAGRSQGVTMPSEPAKIEAVIEEHRARLAATVDELVVRAHPKEIARRGAADAKVRFTAATRTSDGALRTERVVAVAAAALVLVTVVVLLRRRRGRAG
jgi:hypothetical protein